MHPSKFKAAAKVLRGQPAGDAGALDSTTTDNVLAWLDAMSTTTDGHLLHFMKEPSSSTYEPLRRHTQFTMTALICYYKLADVLRSASVLKSAISTVGLLLGHTKWCVDAKAAVPNRSLICKARITFNAGFEIMVRSKLHSIVDAGGLCDFLFSCFTNQQGV